MNVLAYTWPWAITIWIAVPALILIAACLIAGFVIGRGRQYSDAPAFGALWAAGVLVIALIAIVWSGLANIQEQKKTARGLGDAPRPAASVIDGRPVDGITEMADNFPNVATKCVWDGWRVFVTSNGDHLFVVPDDTCKHKNTGPSK